MALLIVLAFVQPRFAQIDLRTERQPAFFIERPNRAADGRQRRHHAVQKSLIEFFGRNFAARQAFNFVNQSTDLLPRLIDQFRLVRRRLLRFAAHLYDRRTAFVCRGGVLRVSAHR